MYDFIVTEPPDYDLSPVHPRGRGTAKAVLAEAKFPKELGDRFISVIIAKAIYIDGLSKEELRTYIEREQEKVLAAWGSQYQEKFDRLIEFLSHLDERFPQLSEKLGSNPAVCGNAEALYILDEHLESGRSGFVAKGWRDLPGRFG